MLIEMISEYIYHTSGIVAAVFLLIIAYFLKKENAEKIKSRIFLKYERFRTAFYIVALGAMFFAVGAIMSIYSHEKFHWLHEITEVLYNTCMAIFAILIFTVLNPKSKKEV